MLDPDKNAEGFEDVFLEARDFLTQVIDSESNNRQRAEEALRFRDGDQWPDDLLNSREIDQRLSITVNHTDTMVTRVENNLKQQRPRIKAHPVGDGADVEKAKTVNGLIRHIENESQASVAYDCGGSSALTAGWGFWRIVGEPQNERSFDQKLSIKAIRNPFTVYKDPMSVLPDGSDSMRYLVSTKMKRIKYKQLYPREPKIEFTDIGRGEGMAEWESRDEIRVAEYYRIVEKPERLFKMVDGSTMFEHEFAAGEIKKLDKASPETLMAAGFALEADGSAVSRMSYRRQVEWYRISGRMVLEKRDLPGRYIPIVFVQGSVTDINGDVRRKGMVENMKEPARLCNYWESSKAERLALAPKAKWVAYNEVIAGFEAEWRDANAKNTAVLRANAVQGPGGELLPLPQRVEPASIEAGMTQASQDAEHLLMAVAGMPHEPGQDSSGEVVSGKAIQQRRALADDTHYHFYDNLTLSIAFTGRLLFDLIPYYYDTQRQQRIIQEDGLPSMIVINESMPDGTVKNDLTVGEYDVVMDTGPGYDTKRLEGSEAMTSLMGTVMGEVVAKAAPDIVMRAYDFPYADEIADRLLPMSPQGMDKAMKELPKQAQSIVMALQQQNSQLTQKLQQLEADLKYGLTKSMHEQATKLQVENMKDARAEKDTATDAQVKLEDTHTRAQTSIAVAEIGAGAQLLNTHAEAAHESVARRETLEAAERAEASNPRAA